jgi:hypothetical protein
MADSGSVWFSFGRSVPSGFEVVLCGFMVLVTDSDSVSNDGRKYVVEAILALILGRDYIAPPFQMVVGPYRHLNSRLEGGTWY